MHFPEPIYLWMVNHGIISNQGTPTLTQDK